MAEYIEREALINHIEDLPTWGADGNLLDREDVIGSIENRLAADVAPVRHGRWGNYEPYSDGYRCSCCRLVHRTCTTYCPRCGAKMDLEG